MPQETMTDAECYEAAKEGVRMFTDGLGEDAASSARQADRFFAMCAVIALRSAMRLTSGADREAVHDASDASQNYAIAQVDAEESATSPAPEFIAHG